MYALYDDTEKRLSRYKDVSSLFEVKIDVLHVTHVYRLFWHTALINLVRRMTFLLLHTLKHYTHALRIYEVWLPSVFKLPWRLSRNQYKIAQN